MLLESRGEWPCSLICRSVYNGHVSKSFCVKKPTIYGTFVLGGSMGSLYKGDQMNPPPLFLFKSGAGGSCQDNPPGLNLGRGGDVGRSCAWWLLGNFHFSYLSRRRNPSPLAWEWFCGVWQLLLLHRCVVGLGFADFAASCSPQILLCFLILKQMENGFSYILKRDGASS